MNHLELRRKLKSRKPRFRRQDSHKKKRLADGWRRPKGSDSKMRQAKKGYRRSVNRGWGSPRDVKGLSREGLAPVKVSCEKDLAGLDKDKHGIVLAHGLGMKKRMLLAKAANDRSLKILNMQDVAKYLAQAEGKLALRKAEKTKRQAEKKEKTKKKEEKAKEKEAEDKATGLDEKVEEVTDKDKKEQEKKEHDKLLITKEGQ